MNDNFVKLWLIGTTSYILKEVPISLFQLIKRLFIIKIQVDGRDELFKKLTKWFEENQYHDDTNILNASSSRVKTKNVDLTFGEGNHFFNFQGTLFWIYRIRERSNDSFYDKEILTLSCFVFNKEKIKALLQLVSSRKTENTIKVYYWSEKYWNFVLERNKRPLDSIYLNTNVKNNILTHLNNFEESKKYSEKIGLPHKTGLCFHGPPGTGKSSLAYALASHYNRDICMLSLSDQTDETILKAVMELKPYSVLLIEDIDTFYQTLDRNLSKTNASHAEKLSLSGLLQALDGYLAPVGTIIIVTTNKPDILDPAIIRAGRIDLMVALDNWNQETLQNVCETFKIDSNLKLALNPAQFMGQLNWIDHEKRLHVD